MSTSEPTHWMVKTKLQPPLPCGNLILRRQLVEKLSKGITSHRLTLLSAPAGYGKTTLLLEVKKKTAPLNTAWLTLDEGDNDPVLFLTYMIMALKGLNPNFGTNRPLLSGRSDPAMQMLRIIGELINEVIDILPEPFVLVLDDLHLITEPSIHIALNYLLEHMPTAMHLVIGARHDLPLALARLRARGQLAELRAPELRFTQDETTFFLNALLQLALNSDDVTFLQTRTEGWPAGLRLLAGSLARIPNPDDRIHFISRFSRTDRRVFDFLADEVLDHQSLEVRRFLLETSILKILTAPLCNTVTNRTDAKVILEDLDRRSLFISAVKPSSCETDPLSSETAFRYHDLFSEFLQHQLEREMPEQIPRLHCRAADALGMTAPAVEHYLAAKHWESAASVIKQISDTHFHRGLVDTLCRWISALPAEICETHSQLLWDFGSCALLKGDAETGRSFLTRALRASEATADEIGQSESLTQLATAALMDSRFAKADELVQQALKHPVPQHNLIQLLMIRVWLGFFDGNWRRAEKDFAAALAMVEDSDNPNGWLTLAFNLHAPLAFLPGGLERIERFCGRASFYVEDPVSPLQLVIDDEMTFIHFWRGRLTETLQTGQRALEIKKKLGTFPFMGRDAAAYLAVAHMVLGEFAVADRYFDSLLDLTGLGPLHEKTVVQFLYMLGRARFLDGRFSEIRQIHTRMCEIQSRGVPPQAAVAILRMEALLEMGERRYTAAERALRQAFLLEREINLPGPLCSTSLLQAYLFYKTNRRNEALVELKPVLLRCQREESPGFILQEGAIMEPLLQMALEHGIQAPFAARLLDILGAGKKPRPVPIPETGEILTPREVEVLRLIVAGAGNCDIASRLFVSEGTVKSHVHRIFRKLDVSSRTEAAARVRNRNLI